MIMNNNKLWFKNQLKLIEIEIFSYCNRRCWFCPNSIIDRHTSNTYMSEDSYLKILEQLKEIDYDNEVTYSRYNEPLAYKDIILKRISQARDFLPNAKLRTNTNGDFITLDYIKELRDSGLNELFIQQYLSNNEYYNHDKINKIMINKIKNIGVKYFEINNINNQRIEYKLDIDGIKVHLRARNFAIEGTSRTNKVDNFNKEYIRTAPCLQPFNNMYIDYNGYVMVCCNTRSDIPSHKNGIMSHIDNGFLWDIYKDEKYNKWRNLLIDESPKTGICRGCKIDLSFT